MFIVDPHNRYNSYRDIQQMVDFELTQLELLDDYSTEGLMHFIKKTLINISDLALGIVLLNKTNITNLLHGLKRSELRAYTDRYAVTIKLIDELPFAKIMNKQLPSPTGLKGKIIDVCDWITSGKFLFKDNRSINKIILNDIREIFNQVMTATTSADLVGQLNINKYSNTYQELNNQLKPIVARHMVLFTPENKNRNIVTKSMAFKEMFYSKLELIDSKKILLTTEKQLLTTKQLVKEADVVSDYVVKIVDAIEKSGYSPSKEYVTGLLKIVGTTASRFDAIGLLVQTQLVVEHNMVLDYHELESFL